MIQTIPLERDGDIPMMMVSISVSAEDTGGMVEVFRSCLSSDWKHTYLRRHFTKNSTGWQSDRKEKNNNSRTQVDQYAEPACSSPDGPIPAVKKPERAGNEPLTSCNTLLTNLVDALI